MSILQIVLLVLSVLVVLGLLYLGYVYKKGKYSKIANKYLLSLVADADIKYGAKTGVLKNSFVFREIYSSMPKLFRILFTEDQVSTLIETALAEFKEYLAKNSDASVSLGIEPVTVEVKL